MKKTFFFFLFITIVPVAVFSADKTGIKVSSRPLAETPSKVIRVIDLPEGYHEDLLYIGDHIWLSNGQGGDVWVISSDSGQVMSSIEPAGPFTEAITPFGDGFWVLTGRTGACTG